MRRALLIAALGAVVCACPAAARGPLDMKYARNYQAAFNAGRQVNTRIAAIVCIHAPATRTFPDYEDCLIRERAKHGVICGRAFLTPVYDNPLSAVESGEPMKCSLVNRIIRNVDASVSPLAS